MFVAGYVSTFSIFRGGSGAGGRKGMVANRL